LSVQAIELE
jgi:hypothetical protein